MFSRPDNSGSNPAPSSSSGTTRPAVFTVPARGRSTRAITLRSVVFPAPSRPRMPSDSPAPVDGNAKDLDQVVHRVYGDEPSDPVGHDVERVHDRGEVHPAEQHGLIDLDDVVELDTDARQQERQSKGAEDGEEDGDGQEH